MRLKTLTIKGFKSFATETVLNFNDNIIGVVGPNGSGKSNVVDAIRWVLGEQKSRELRLKSMGDVIFNGTKKRKAGGSASVTLTFENDRGILPSEYQNVAISRVLYRSGESEYKLNGITCRRKDIQSLLMDTGIGSNSYAIIALGMVDDILSDKENARRRMFEQAAGISKYKVRKHETLNKLKGTTADLDRVEDLLFEIEGNLKTLERQAKRAQKYLDIKQEYKDLSILYATISIKSLKEQYKSIESQLKSEQQKHTALDADINTKEALLQKEKNLNLEKEQHLSKHQRQLGELTQRIRSKESERDLSKQKKSFAEKTVENLEKELLRINEQLEAIKLEVASLTDRVNAEKKNGTGLDTRVADLLSEYNAIKEKYALAKGDNDTISKKRETLSKSIFEAEKSIALANNTIQNSNREIERRNQELQERKNKYKSVKSDLTELEKELTILKERLAQLQKEQQQRKEDIETYSKEREALLTKKASINRSLDSKQNEYDLLKSMVDNYEGFPESIKFLSTTWREDIPVLSDLLGVSEKYKSAIEQYLEPYLNHFVVDDMATAKQAIELLTQSQKGKANFIILENVPPGSNTIKPPVDLEVARQHIEVDSKYDDLLDQLLKEVYIYTGELNEFRPDDNATYLSDTGRFLGGKMVLTGGSIGLFEGNKIGRKKNLEKLLTSIETIRLDKNTIKEQVSSVEQKLSDARSRNSINDINKLQKEITGLEQQQVRLSLQTENYKTYKKEVLQKEEKATLIIQANEKTIAEKQQLLQQVNVELKELDSNIESASSELEQLSAQLSQSSERYNTENISMIRHQNLVEGLERDLAYKTTKTSDLQKQLSQSEIKKRDELSFLSSIDTDIEAIEQQLVKYYEERKTYKSQLNEAEQKYFSTRNEIAAIEEEVKELHRSQNQIRLLVQQLRDEYTDIKFKMTAVGERLKIEFDIALNDIINNEIQDDIDEQQIEEKVHKLKSRLSSYGDINPMAVQAYDEMKKRHESITAQRQDILEAKASLMSTISEIENTATELFLKALDNVRTHFIEVFRSLFSEEDNCDLILVDPENPLSSPIDIIAKPKGKRPKSLSQLSGGEKTLTATALLFALYLLKPAPFCIFDEVDAPLDDANIEKFNRIIHKFSKKSQFIIVTHNKSTMAAVDILYGVYMQEMGVSAVTPVDFRTFEGKQYLETLN